MKQLIALIGFLSLTACSFAQSSITLSGIVKDSSSGRSLAGVSVFLNSTSKGTVTKADGTFMLGIPAGSPCLHLERAFSDGARTVLVVFARLPGIRVGIRTNLTPDTWPSGPDAGE